MTLDRRAKKLGYDDCVCSRRVEFKRWVSISMIWCQYVNILPQRRAGDRCSGTNYKSGRPWLAAEEQTRLSCDQSDRFPAEYEDAGTLRNNASPCTSRQQHTLYQYLTQPSTPTTTYVDRINIPATLRCRRRKGRQTILLLIGTQLVKAST